MAFSIKQIRQCGAKLQQSAKNPENDLFHSAITTVSTRTIPRHHNDVTNKVFTDPTSQKIAKDRKFIAWTLTYRSPERTLETAEVDAAHQRILAALEKSLPATVRK